MSEASYTAWDDNLYEWPPPAGWYQASDGKWWPEGYGPPTADAPATAGGDGPAFAQDHPGDDQPGQDQPGQDHPGDDQPGQDQPGHDQGQGSHDSTAPSDSGGQDSGFDPTRTAVFPAGSPVPEADEPDVGDVRFAASRDERVRAEAQRPVYDEPPPIDDIFGFDPFADDEDLDRDTGDDNADTSHDEPPDTAPADDMRADAAVADGAPADVPRADDQRSDDAPTADVRADDWQQDDGHGRRDGGIPVSGPEPAMAGPPNQSGAPPEGSGPAPVGVPSGVGQPTWTDEPAPQQAAAITPAAYSASETTVAPGYDDRDKFQRPPSQGPIGQQGYEQPAQQPTVQQPGPEQYPHGQHPHEQQGPGGFGVTAPVAGQGSSPAAGPGVAPQPYPVDDRYQLDQQPDQGGSKGGKLLFVLGVLVLAGLAGAASWFVFLREDDAGSSTFDLQAAEAATGLGSLDQPYDFGAGVVVFYDGTQGEELRWTIQVLDAVADQTSQLVSEQGADQPPAGEVLAVARVQVTYENGPDPGPLDDLDLDSIGPSRVLFSQNDGACPVADPLNLAAGLQPGSSIEGNLCWQVPSGDLAQLRLAVQAEPTQGAVFLGLN